MSSKKLNPFKDFQSNQIQRSSRKIFTAHYACRNAALNLTPVTGTTNGFIFQIINSLIESWGVHLTWFDCNARIITNHNSLLVTVLFAQQFYKREVFSSNLQSSSVKFFQVKKERSHVWPLNSNRTCSAAWHLSCRSWICCCHFSSSSLAFCSVCGWTNYSYRVSLERSTHRFRRDD